MEIVALVVMECFLGIGGLFIELCFVVADSEGKMADSKKVKHRKQQWLKKENHLKL